MDFVSVSKDTTLDAARIRFSILRKIGFAGRATMAFELSDGLRSTVESGVRQRHPEYDEKMVKLTALYIAIGEDLFHRFYPDIEVKGK